MKLALFIGCAFMMFCAQAQRVRTIVPRQPVLIGNAFQVQYVITDPAQWQGIDPPVSDSLVLISGPNIYKGNMMIDGRLQPIRNVTYTFSATVTGRVRIREVEARFTNGEERTVTSFITVQPQPKASFTPRSNYLDETLYAPASGADLEQLIAQNLFVRTEVDRTRCYQGEPVVATFKLYSRLQSSSEVMNAPSLYGFSVADMLNVNEAHTAVETVHGKFFNTSILRQLQLYPEQSGRLVIDPMEMDHEIELIDTLNGGQKKIVKRTMHTAPTYIEVKPLPASAPADFTGAVGKFQLHLQQEKTEWPAGEAGRLELTIEGAGNFLQMGRPQPEWPRGFDVMEPIVRESLNNTRAPLSGSRTWIYSFIAYQPGNYTMAPVRFSYFDPFSVSYKTLTTDSITLRITPATSRPKQQSRTTDPVHSTHSILWITILLLLTAAIMVWLVYRKKKIKPANPVIIKPPTLSERIREIDETIQDDVQACLRIGKLLEQAVTAYPSISLSQIQQLRKLQAECQLVAYAPLDAKGIRERLVSQALELAAGIES